MKKIYLIALLFVISLQATEKFNINFEKFKLTNGLTVILHRDNTRPIVSVGFLYHVGSKDESPNRTGFAHFFEHLMFEGSKNIKRGEFDKLILNAGGESNAHTTFDQTYYEASIPSNQLPLILWMESERLLHLKINPEGVETQRKVVKEERSERLDNVPYGDLIEILHQMSFRKHSYKWLPIGSNQYIDKATLEEFNHFHKKYYTPDNGVLVIAGDIDSKSTKELVEKYFNRIPKSKKKLKRNKVIEPPLKKEIQKTVYANVEFPSLTYAFHAPNQGTNDYYPFVFVDLILSGGESSRLVYNLKTKNNVIINVEATYRAMEDYGLYSITSYAKDKSSYEKVPANLEQELKRLQTEFVSDRELEKVRNQIQKNIYATNANLAGIAENLAEYETFYGNASLINTEYEKVLSIKKEDIQRVAKKYFTLDKKIILHYLPNKYKK